MSSIVILLGFSLLIAGGFLVAFLWSMKKGQYDDTYTPSIRMLFDEEMKEKTEGTFIDTNAKNQVIDKTK